MRARPPEKCSTTMKSPSSVSSERERDGPRRGARAPALMKQRRTRALFVVPLWPRGQLAFDAARSGQMDYSAALILCDLLPGTQTRCQRKQCTWLPSQWMSLPRWQRTNSRLEQWLVVREGVIDHILNWGIYKCEIVGSYRKTNEQAQFQEFFS